MCGNGCGRAATMEVLRRHCTPQEVGRGWQTAAAGEAPDGRPCTSCGNASCLVRIGDSEAAQVSLCTSCHLAWVDADAWTALPHRPPDPPKRSRFASIPPRPAAAAREPTAPAPVARPAPKPAPPRAAIGRTKPEAPDPSLDTPLPPLPVEPARRNDPAALRGHLEPTDDAAPYSFASIPGIPDARRGMVTWGVIASLAVVGATTMTLPGAAETFGFKPARPLAGAGLPLVSSFYVHVTLAHLLVSVYFLAALGDRVEAMLGTRRYLSTLLAGTVFGSLAYALGGPTSEAPLVGAGAGITALIVLYGLSVPRARISFLIFFDHPRLSVWSFLGLWTMVQFVGDFAIWGAGSPTPYSLQLAGGVVGFVAWFGVLFEGPERGRPGAPSRMVTRRRR